VAALSLASCYRASWYNGDGELTDAGWLVLEGNRYKLDLGPLDLTVSGSHTFRLSNLPNAEFTAGIEIIEPEPIPTSDAQPEHTSYVRLELKTSNGEVVVLEEGPLNTWVWSHALRGSTAFLYRRGESRDVPTENGSVRVEPVGLKAANGWGSYFQAERSETYILTFQVIEPRNTAKRPARLMLHSV
jgi:hypothetical protein